MPSIIQSLWIGESLSNLEKLCVQSFLDHGHGFHLYTYGAVDGVPDGATLLDGNGILSADKIFRHRGGSVAGFADWFRYALLGQKGGWWVDMDTVCLRPFDFQQELILHHCADGLYTNTPLYAEPGNALMLAMAKRCREYPNKAGSRFAVVGGPRPLTHAIVRMGLQAHGVPFRYFELGGWATACNKSYAGGLERLPPDCHCLHFGNEFIRRNNWMDKNAVFDTESLFEQLKARHGIANLPNAKRITSETINAMLLADDATAQQKRVAKIRRRVTVAVVFAVLVGLLVAVQL